jgi:hypothetical protein
LCLRGLRMPTKDTIMYALVMFATQFVIVAVFPAVNGYRLWSLFALLIGNFMGVHHPPAEIEKPLDGPRIALGWLSLAIFVICFSPTPFILEVIGMDIKP